MTTRTVRPAPPPERPERTRAVAEALDVSGGRVWRAPDAAIVHRGDLERWNGYQRLEREA